MQNKDWRFSLKLNGSHNKNKILAISNALAAANDEANASSTGKPKVLYKEGAINHGDLCGTFSGD